MKKKITIAASTVLCLYAIYKILVFTSSAFNPLRSFRLTFGAALKYLLLYSLSSWSILALGLCGFMLVYANTNKNRESGPLNRLIKIKNIVFIAFIALSTGSLFAVIYNAYGMYQTYHMIMTKGFDVTYRTIAEHKFSYIGVAFGTLITIGGILFGLYIITKKEGLLKPFILIYLIGFSGTLLSKTYDFIFALHRNGLMPADPSQISLFGLTKNYTAGSIIYFSSFILVMTASLIIILYGIKKEKILSKHEVVKI